MKSILSCKNCATTSAHFGSLESMLSWSVQGQWQNTLQDGVLRRGNPRLIPKLVYQANPRLVTTKISPVFHWPIGPGGIPLGKKTRQGNFPGLGESRGPFYPRETETGTFPRPTSFLEFGLGEPVKRRTLGGLYWRFGFRYPVNGLLGLNFTKCHLTMNITVAPPGGLRGLIHLRC